MKEKGLLIKKDKKGKEKYCSICMEKVTEHGHKKHQLVNALEPVCEDDILYYTIRDDENHLRLDIHNKKQVIFSLFFNSKGILKSFGEEDWEFWKDMLKHNFLYENYKNTPRFLSFTENECQLINKYFPTVYKIDNIGRFLQSLENKNIKSRQIDIATLNKIPYGKVDLSVGRKYDNQRVRLCKLKEYPIGDLDVVFEVIYVIGKVVNARIVNPVKYRFFISKDFIYNPKAYNLNSIISDSSSTWEKTVYERYSYQEFHHTYPEVKLKEFIESGGKDVVRFILANNNDTPFEIIGKAGLGYIAEISDQLDINRNGKNIKEFFTLPVKAMKSLNTENGSQFLIKNLKVVKDTYQKIPAIFESQISDSGLRFIDDMKRYKSSLGQDILKYFRFANKLDTKDYELYMDYLRMCGLHKMYPFSRYPAKLKMAHDMMVIYEKQRKEALDTIAFDAAIQCEEYQNLRGEIGEYRFLIPRNANDLVNESYQMHNCVRSYIRSVCCQYVYIVLLRYRKRPSASFVTVEVTNDYMLRQVKGKCNTTIDKETAEAVKEWCTEKGIDYTKCYDLKEAMEKRWR